MHEDVFDEIRGDSLAAPVELLGFRLHRLDAPILDFPPRAQLLELPLEVAPAAGILFVLDFFLEPLFAGAFLKKRNRCAAEE